MINIAGTSVAIILTPAGGGVLTEDHVLGDPMLVHQLMDMVVKRHLHQQRHQALGPRGLPGGSTGAPQEVGMDHLNLGSQLEADSLAQVEVNSVLT